MAPRRVEVEVVLGVTPILVALGEHLEQVVDRCALKMEQKETY